MAVQTPAASHVVTDPFLTSILTTSAELRELVITQLTSIAAALGPTQTPRDLPDEAQLALSQQNKRVQASLAQLRGLNRDAAHRVRQTKLQTAESRSEVDRLHLQLQNLLYEQNHLHGEIRACAAYPHPYLQLPLANEDDFLAAFPEHRDDDEGTLMAARIEHEYLQRTQLESQRQELLKKKQGLIAENAKRKDELAKLDKDLEAFIESARPIQQTLEKGLLSEGAKD